MRDADEGRHPHEREIRALREQEGDETSAGPILLVALIIIAMVVAVLIL